MFINTCTGTGNIVTFLLPASRHNAYSTCTCHRSQWFWFVWNLPLFYRCL